MSSSEWENLIHDFSFQKLLEVLQHHYHIFKVAAKQSTAYRVQNLDYIDIVIIWTIFLFVSLYILRKVVYLFSSEFRQDFKRRAMKIIKNLPIVKQQIQKEFTKIENEINRETDAKRAHKTYKLPSKGMKSNTVKEKIDGLIKREHDLFRDHKVHGTVYYNDKKDVINVVRDACKEFLYHNPLHYDMYPTATQMEAEVISMTAHLYNGGKTACGITTSGGTESILMSILTYRDWARDTKGIKNPELVAPKTAHVAFEKACHYFGIKYVTVDVNIKTGLAPLGKIKSAINSNTIAVVASCASFPYGTIDDIPRLSKITKRYNVGLHVDCCLGSFIVPFCAENGVKLPTFDFQLDGVTTISVDPHKFGQAPKGISVLLFKNKELRKFAIYATAKWPGGIYATPTMAGSRPAAPIAGAWAAMMYYGHEGYSGQAKLVLEAAQKFAEGIRDTIPQLTVIGDPKTSVVAFRSTKRNLDIYAVYDACSKKGWKMGALQKPPGMHLSVTPFNASTIDSLLVDLKEAVEQVLANPKAKKTGMSAIYGTAQVMPQSFVEQGAVIAIESVLNLM